MHHSLDTIDWNGGNTSLQSLAFDCPIVTLPTKYMRGRHTVSMLKEMEIDELIASNYDEYVDISNRLINDKFFYQKVKKQISDNKYVLYDEPLIPLIFPKIVKELCSKEQH